MLALASIFKGRESDGPRQFSIGSEAMFSPPRNELPIH